MILDIQTCPNSNFWQNNNVEESMAHALGVWPWPGKISTEYHLYQWEMHGEWLLMKLIYSWDGIQVNRTESATDPKCDLQNPENLRTTRLVTSIIFSSPFPLFSVEPIVLVMFPTHVLKGQLSIKTPPKFSSQYWHRPLVWKNYRIFPAPLIDRRTKDRNSRMLNYKIMFRNESRRANWSTRTIDKEKTGPW